MNRPRQDILFIVLRYMHGCMCVNKKKKEKGGKLNRDYGLHSSFRVQQHKSNG